MAELAFNNGHQESIKHTPFFANYGINPEYQTIGHLMQGQITPPENMSQLHNILRAEMKEAQLRHKKYYDEGRKPDPNLQSGEMLWLLPRNICTTRSCKRLDYKRISPFEILAKIGESAYKLDLPPSIRIHNRFHISLLELYHHNKFPSQRTQPRPPIIIEREPEYELKEIIDSHLHYGKLLYRAKWTSYPHEHDKVWYPYDNFENADIAKQQFHQQYPGKLSRNQDRRTRELRDVGLHITNTATRTTTTSKNDDTKTIDTKDPPGRMGNHRRTTDKRPIPSPIPVGRSGKERTSSPRARPAVMDSMLRRRVQDPLSRQGSHVMVSPRPISVNAISTNIVQKQETREEMRPERHCVGQMLRGQMFCPCPRKNKPRVLPTGKWRKKDSVKMAPESPRARTTKSVRCREDTAGERGA